MTVEVAVKGGGDVAREKPAGVRPPLVVHVIHRLAIGGLENGVVNLVNGTPPSRFRHAIVCLTDHTGFRDRITRPDVPVFCLGKREGKEWGAYVRLWRLLRKLNPDILHTRTMATLDAQVWGMLAGVAARVHGEHGQASSWSQEAGLKQRLTRRALGAFVDNYITVNSDLSTFLTAQLGIATERVTRVYNGVDTVLFHPRSGQRRVLMPGGFAHDDSIVIGTVGRAQPVKDQGSLVEAFLHLIESSPALRQRLRLVIVGGGPLLCSLQCRLDRAGAAHLAWLTGDRADVPELLRGMDVFVLPSLGEGTSNTILEAMATGLPVIATRVGGNPELVREGWTGWLVPPGTPAAIAERISDYVEAPLRMAQHGAEGRRVTEESFSMKAMIEDYLRVYDYVLARKRPGFSSPAKERVL